MGTPAIGSRSDTSTSKGVIPVRPSGVMPAFRGKVSLPAPALRLAPAPSDDAEWAAALAASKQRAELEEEERAWQRAMAAARARAAEEEREWAALRARAASRVAPRRPARLVSWP